MNMNKRFLSLLMAMLLVVSLLCAGTAFADSKETPVQAAKHAVVRLFMEDKKGNTYFGSAFGIGKSGKEPEFFITNAHCCLDENEELFKNIYIITDNSAIVETKSGSEVDYSKMVKCEVVNKDTISMFPDAAVIKAAKPISGRTTLKLRESSDEVKEAQQVHALGFPGDIDILTESSTILASVDDVNFTSGTVSQKMKAVKGAGDTDLVAHTAQIAHGNSGGPLIDENGAVVGINTYGVTSASAGTDGNYYFAVYIDYAIKILKDHKIPYELSHDGTGLDGKTIGLIVAIIAIIAAAALLILNFQKKKNQWIDDKEQKEAKELRLQGISGAFAGRRFKLEGQVSMGRAPGNSIVFPTQTKGVSGNHCVVIVSNGQIYVKDVGSSNGTFVDSTTRIPPNQMVSIKVGDRISLGSENETFMITYKGGKV